jgi:hypothetical protein
MLARPCSSVAATLAGRGFAHASLSPVIADSPLQCGYQASRERAPIRAGASARPRPVPGRTSAGAGRHRPPAPAQAVQAERDALPVRLQHRFLGAPHAEEPVLAGGLVQAFSQATSSGWKKRRTPAGAAAAAAAPGPRPAARLRPAPPAAPRRCGSSRCRSGPAGAQLRPALVVADQRQRLRGGPSACASTCRACGFTALPGRAAAPDRHRSKRHGPCGCGGHRHRPPHGIHDGRARRIARPVTFPSPPRGRSWASSSG